MKTIAELIGLPVRDADLGLELEVESDHNITGTVYDKYGDQVPEWRAVGEGSLRGYGAEFITRNPVTVRQAGPLLEALAHHLKELGARVSPRTSFHVHVNMCTATPIQVWNAACAYWLFEGPLIEYCGEHRKGNHFCLRLKDAEHVLDTCIRDIEHHSIFGSMANNDDIRYSALNLGALGKFGSLEFRGMRGLLDSETMYRWARSMLRLTRKAQEYSSPSFLLDSYFIQDKRTFMETFFHPEMCDILTHVKGWEDDLHESALRLCPLVYDTDWEHYEEYTQNISQRL